MAVLPKIIPQPLPTAVVAYHGATAGPPCRAGPEGGSMRSMLLAALLLLAPAGFAAPTTSLAVKDIFELELAADPQISPDGRQVVYVRQFEDIMDDRRRSN